MNLKQWSEGKTTCALAEGEHQGLNMRMSRRDGRRTGTGDPGRVQDTGRGVHGARCTRQGMGEARNKPLEEFVGTEVPDESAGCTATHAMDKADTGQARGPGKAGGVFGSTQSNGGSTMQGNAGMQTRPMSDHLVHQQTASSSRRLPGP